MSFTLKIFHTLAEECIKYYRTTVPVCICDVNAISVCVCVCVYVRACVRVCAGVCGFKLKSHILYCSVFRQRPIVAALVTLMYC